MVQCSKIMLIFEFVFLVWLVLVDYVDDFIEYIFKRYFV